MNNAESIAACDAILNVIQIGLIVGGVLFAALEGWCIYKTRGIFDGG